MRTKRKNRLSTNRRSMFRKNHLRLEPLETRLALATFAANDFYHDLVDQSLEVAAPGVLANDTSDTGSVLAAGLFSGPSHGSLELGEDGSFAYLPEAGYAGLDSFLYFANDGASDSMLAAVTIRVGDGGPPPDAIDDSYTVDEDGALSVAFSDGVLANDTAAEGQLLSAEVVSGPSNGTLVLGLDGSLTYIPTANFHGSDSFTYSATDATGESDTATATITVNPVNDKPSAANDAHTVGEDATLTVDVAAGLLANDTDIDGDTLTPTITSEPLHGTVALNPDGSFTYTPEANFNGLDGFSYLVSDGTTTSDVASATITVTPVNDLPVNANDEFTTAEDSPLEVAAPGVLVNDTDIDGDALSSILVNPPQHGTVTLGGDGALLYTPDADFNGVDGFSYLANDGSADSDAAAVTINVTSVNDAPAGAPDAYATDEDLLLVVDSALGVLANDSDADGDPLSATVVAGPANGALALNADGSFTYTPNANFSGTDSFTYSAGDGALSSEAMTVSLTVNPINDGPVSAADTYLMAEDETLTVDATHGVIANDSDPDGDALSATVVSGPTNGSLTLNADGSFTYAPNANFHGLDSFSYQVSDGTLTSSETTVTISICPQNDAPTSADDAWSMDQGTTLDVDAATGVLANDSDIDGDSLTAAVVSGPANGLLTLNADGSFSYQPSASFSGIDSFVYAASDGDLESQSTVTITVNPVAPAPVTATDNYSTGEDVPLVVGTDLGVLANDLSPQGGALAAEVVTGPAHGTLSLNADGSFSFTPEANFHGADSFTYKAMSDGQEMISSANIVIEPLNDAPAATNDEFTIAASGGEAPATPDNVLSNDSDIDGDTLLANLVVGPNYGTLTLNSDGTFVYTPEEGFSGNDSFRYQAFDGKANSNVATVTLHVDPAGAEVPPTEENPGCDMPPAEETPPAEEIPPTEEAPPAPNQRPLAVNDMFTMQAGAPLDVLAASGLLLNDSDPEGGPITAALFANPLHGSVIVAADGSFSYTPDGDYAGLDAFLYRVSDGELWSPLAAVTIHVTAADGPDETPVPAPTPTPCPPRPHCEDGGGAHGHHGNSAAGLARAAQRSDHAAVIDEIFSQRRGWWS